MQQETPFSNALKYRKTVGRRPPRTLLGKLTALLQAPLLVGRGLAAPCQTPPGFRLLGPHSAVLQVLLNTLHDERHCV